jgi:cytochrome c biogenesis protein CcmG, thiol:disulfide interchange protein DsbE
MALLALGVGHAAQPLQIGHEAPALVVRTLDGHSFDLKALRGKVVIVNFWATWCAPCRAEMPRLDTFYREQHAKGVELLGLSVDEASEAPAVARIMKSFSYPAALASSAKVDDFGPPLAVPTTWIIDPSGIVRARLIAGTAVTKDSLEHAVLPLLEPAARHP